MSLEFLPCSVLNDVEAWEIFKKSEYRWTFNKLEVSLRQGLSAGPAATAPEEEGWYIQRPVYNLFGLGVGAKKFYYRTEESEYLSNYGKVPPGHFWCEWLEGEHLSVNYRKDVSNTWSISSVWKGVHFSDDNLTKFHYWEKVSTDIKMQVSELPTMVSWLYDSRVTCFNLEIKNNYIIEIHLRSGDEVFDGYQVGDKLFPIWNEDSQFSGEVVPEPDPDLKKYKGNGYVSDIRNGFLVVRK